MRLATLSVGERGSNELSYLSFDDKGGKGKRESKKNRQKKKRRRKRREKGKTLDVKVKDERSIYARVISFSRYIHVRLGIKFLIFETLKKEGTLSIYHVRSIR